MASKNRSHTVDVCNKCGCFKPCALKNPTHCEKYENAALKYGFDLNRSQNKDDPGEDEAGAYMYYIAMLSFLVGKGFQLSKIVFLLPVNFLFTTVFYHAFEFVSNMSKDRMLDSSSCRTQIPMTKAGYHKHINETGVKYKDVPPEKAPDLKEGDKR